MTFYHLNGVLGFWGFGVLVLKKLDIPPFNLRHTSPFERLSSIFQADLTITEISRIHF